MPDGDRIGIVVQARMGSSRLPGKVLRPIFGKPLLHRLYDRVKLSRLANIVLVATSDQPADQAIEAACVAWGIPVFRGPEKDLTTRLLRAGREHRLTALIRVTADNPLTDPAGIDELIEMFEKKRPSLVHNVHRLGYPYGTGAELISMSVLESYHRELVSLDDRELVFSIARSQPDRYPCVKVNAPPELFRPQYFLTADYPEGFALLDLIYGHFEGRDDVELGEVVKLLDSDPSLGRLNSHLHQGFTE